MVLLPLPAVLYNDMNTNHFVCPMGTMIDLGKTTPFDDESFTYDPYIKCLWITSRNGKLIKDAKLVTQDVYRQVYAQAAMEKQEQQMAVAMSQHSRLGEVSLLHLLCENTMKVVFQNAFQ